MFVPATFAAEGPHQIPDTRREPFNAQRFCAHLFLLLVVTFVSLGGLEAASRAYLRWIASEDTFTRYASYEQFQARHGASARLYDPHPYLGYVAAARYRRGPNYHNSLGYRGPEIPVPKPAGTTRIVALGGSTTYTSAVADPAKSYPAQLEAILRDRGFPVDVVNAGVPGWTSYESLINLELRLLDLEPDLLVVYHGINDVGPRFVWPADAYRGDNTGALSVPLGPAAERSIAEHSTLLRALLIKFGLAESQARLAFLSRPAPTAYGGRIDGGGPLPVSPEAMLAANPPRYFRRNLANLIAVARAHEIRVVLATFAHYRPEDASRRSFWDTPAHLAAVAEHNAVLVDLAQTDAVPLFDFAGVFPNDLSLYNQYEQDGEPYVDLYHVNETGAARKAELFAEFLERLSLFRASGG